MLGFLRRLSPQLSTEPSKPIPSLAKTPAQRVALSLIEGNLDLETRKRFMEVVAGFPLPLLHQLKKDGVSFSTFEAAGRKTDFGETEKMAASYSPSRKQILTPKDSLSDKDIKRFVAHEVGHAIDHQLRLREVSLDRVSGSKIYDQMNSTHDRQMKKLFKQFTARQLASEATRGETRRGYPGTVFETRVSQELPDKLRVSQKQTEYRSKSSFTKRDGGWGFGWASKATYSFNGEIVVYKEKGAEQSVVISKMTHFPTLSWLISPNSGQYLQQSGQPAELFADGVGAYLGSNENKSALQMESKELFEHVQGELQRYYQ